MQQYNCPNCGAPLVFHSSVSVHTTCAFCRSMVVRHDMNLETIGQVAELLDDMSPFQVGTRGTYKGQNFMLVGRIKVLYDKGTWSEWYAYFDDGREGWLAEAQGNYMMTYGADASRIQFEGAIKPLAEAKIDQTLFFVEDVKEVTYAASEGELPQIFKPKEQVTSVDLRSENGVFASMTIKGDGRHLFIGEYVEFDTFDFQYLRTLDGW